MFKMKNSYIILLLIWLKLCLIKSKIISIPFKFKETKSSYYIYNSTDFLNENFKKDLVLQMKIGTPFQKIDTYLNQDSSCFQFISSETNSDNDYCPYKSNSFNINQIEILSPSLKSGSDIIFLKMKHIK